MSICLHACMCTTCMPRALRSHWSLVTLELWPIDSWSTMWIMGTEPRFSARTWSSLNHRAVFELYHKAIFTSRTPYGYLKDAAKAKQFMQSCVFLHVHMHVRCRFSWKGFHLFPLLNKVLGIIYLVYYSIFLRFTHWKISSSNVAGTVHGSY